MKHRVAFRKLNRDCKHRWAMLRNMATQLIQHERIQTTLPKAKELRRVADQMVTLAKRDTPRARDRARAVIRDDLSVEKLFSEFGPRYENRQGGYTRVLKTNRRHGDNAEMAVIEYIDRPGELRASKPGQPFINPFSK